MKVVLPSFPLASLPTPVEPLERLSALLAGPALFVKRDDLTGLAFGGNKARKLSYLLADALAQQANHLVTRGALQSNHCRQTAAAAARAGIGCSLVLAGNPPVSVNGNLLLDQLLGAELIWLGDTDPEEGLREATERLRSLGRRVYPIPYGGSNALGAAAYAQAMFELLEQDSGFDTIVLASSSGGTQAGLVAGARMAGFKGKVMGISVDRSQADLTPIITNLATEVAALLGESPSAASEDVVVSDRFVGQGYAVMGELEREAISLFARTEGILLDPVYTGRAAGGLLAMINRREIVRGQRVLFWHTGGTPALFAYADALASPTMPG
jgi:D-cysteine desulfhydrase family pyridoxal phosphate-dependent enzyme